MNKRLLLLGGHLNLAIAALHIAMAFLGPEVLRFFAAPGWVVHSSFSTRLFVCVVLAMIFTVFALYAYSGADRIRPLPMTKFVLRAIGIVYVLRGLLLFMELWWLAHGWRFQHQRIAFSLTALVIGALYLRGAGE